MARRRYIRHSNGAAAAHKSCGVKRRQRRLHASSSSSRWCSERRHFSATHTSSHLVPPLCCNNLVIRRSSFFSFSIHATLLLCHWYVVVYFVCLSGVTIILRTSTQVALEMLTESNNLLTNINFICLIMNCFDSGHGAQFPCKNLKYITKKATESFFQRPISPPIIPKLQKIRPL